MRWQRMNPTVIYTRPLHYRTSHLNPSLRKPVSKSYYLKKRQSFTENLSMATTWSSLSRLKLVTIGVLGRGLTFQHLDYRPSTLVCNGIHHKYWIDHHAPSTLCWWYTLYHAIVCTVICCLQSHDYGFRTLSPTLTSNSIDAFSPNQTENEKEIKFCRSNTFLTVSHKQLPGTANERVWLLLISKPDKGLINWGLGTIGMAKANVLVKVCWPPATKTRGCKGETLEVDQKLVHGSITAILEVLDSRNFHKIPSLGVCES